MFKTLQQVEPRVPISSLPITIASPGSYYLTANLTGIAGQNGITITSDGVTIDLNGFTLTGVSGALDGIRVDGPHTNITVRNGSVLRWPGDGVDAINAVNSQLRDLNAARNNASGLRIGDGSLISSCTARANSFDGITASPGSRLINCTTSNNGGQGLLVGTGGTAEGCTAFDNAGNGIRAGGAAASILNCVAYSNGTNGVSITTGSVINCVSSSNSGNGIQVGSGCYVQGNNCTANTFAGILVTSTGNRIDSNHCVGGQRGFDINGIGNLIIRNSARFATVNYDIVAGNHSAEVITTPGANFSSTSPWANFSF